jgi:outer membrane lipoprotein-sorting protein
MVRKPSLFFLALFVSSLFLTACPKKIVKVPPLEIPPVTNPIGTVLEAFSAAETLQAKASIRIDTERKGEELNYRIQGIVFYQKPERLRVYGYHPFPLPMDLFDALYRDGEFFLFIPMSNRAYAGEVAPLADLIEKTEVRIVTEKAGASDIPNRIRIEVAEHKTRIEILLRETSINNPLPEDSFQWQVPQGVELRPLAQLLRAEHSTSE